MDKIYLELQLVKSMSSADVKNVKNKIYTRINKLNYKKECFEASNEHIQT